MSKSIHEVRENTLEKRGTLISEDASEIIVYEIDDKTKRPVKELGRIKL